MTTILFPGKFQPPHIGHILTISKLLKHGRVIVGITEGEPRVISREEVQTIFETVFTTRAEYKFIDGTLTDYTDMDKLPEFDVVATGNDEVIEWGLKLGLSVKKVPRSKGIGYSGTELRELHNE